MENQKISTVQTIFRSRLDTLSHLLDVAEQHFAGDRDSLLQQRIAPDMLPFGTQITFTCNQPRNFALWCLGESDSNLNPDVRSFAVAREHMASTQALLATIAVDDPKLPASKRLDLGQGMYIELSGLAYVNDFLMPNFYFHLTTAYAILRMAGAPIGKRDYMRHLVPLIQQKG
jgi:uncharacterized protein